MSKYIIARLKGKNAMIYTFNKNDDGIIGKAFEMAIKDILSRKNADKVSPCGSADFRYNSKNYDTKQNGSCIRYNGHSKYVKGANRVIYATHIAHRIVTESDTQIAIEIDLGNTSFFEVDKTEFINFLLSINCIKVNESRGTVNIQTVYNYKKDAYHGAKGKKIEQWCYENELEDNITSLILDKLD